MANSKSNLPKSFGRFTVDEVLGRGGMGIVYRAHDPLIGRPVAIKVLKLEAGSHDESSELRGRFEQEFRSAGTLSHPNLVTIYDVGNDDGSAYIAMECVDGDSLDVLIRSGRELSFKRVAEIAMELCEGLDYAHSAGVVHRDVKPANILLTNDGHPKITDFGVAKLVSSQLTQTGTVVGTPSYMSPEQITAQTITGACDQFAVAVILYQMLTGKLPFTGDIPASLLYKIVHEDPVPPHEINPELPQSIDAALMRSFSKKPSDRYPSCRALAVAVREALGATPRVPEESRNRTVTLSGAALPVGSGTYDGAMSWWQRQSAGPRVGLMTAGALLVAALGWFAVGAYIDAQNDRLASGADDFLATQPMTDSEATTDTGTGETSAPEQEEDQLTETEDVNLLSAEQVVPPQTFLIVSTPEGAQVTLDDQLLEETTPVEVTLIPGENYDINVSKSGFIDQGSQRLDPAEHEDGVLSYVLRRRIVPGTLSFEADYEVVIETGGKSWSSRRFSLDPGQHELRIVAADVFHRRTETVEIKSGETTVLEMKPAVTIRLVSVQGDATVQIDGEGAFTPPTDISLVLGDQHRFRFEWPDGQNNEKMIAIGQTVRRIIGSPDEITQGS